MTKSLSPHVYDTMMACSRKLFNAAQDGNPDYALSVMKTVSETLTFTMSYVAQEGNNGTH